MTEDLYVQFVALLAAALLVPAVVFLAMGISQPKMSYWRILASGMGCIFFASILSALRDFLPVLASTLSANILVGAGYFLNVKASRSLDSINRHNASDLTILVVYSGLSLAVNLFANSYEYRLTVVSAGICVFSALTILQLISMRDSLNKLGVWIVVSVAAANMFLALARAAAALWGSEIHILSLSFWDPVFFIGSIAIVFGFSIGYFIIGSSILSTQTEALLDHERILTQKLNASIEDQKNLQKLVLHEIKRPINALSAALQVVQSSDHTHLYSHNAKDLLRLVNQAGSFLDGISEYDELSGLFDHPNKEFIPLIAIEDDIRSKWRIGIDINEDSRAIVIFADPLLVDIALGNLIENAQKFGHTPDNVRLFIHSDTTHILFDIEDDGPGVPSHEWGRIWGKFYRMGASSSNAIKGCGLGLHAVKRIAEVHGGYARVLSQMPSCVRFAITRTSGSNNAERA